MRTLLLFIIIIITTTSVYSQCTRTAAFQDANYEVDGTVTLEYTLSGDKLLKIGSNFATMSGPDLHIYLANVITINTSSGDPAGTIDLGLLSSITGASQYTIPANVKINDYAYIIIQCKQFNQPWGNATLGAMQGADCSSLSIEDNLLESISFYPNPAKNKVNFNLNSQSEINVTIYNYSGIKVLQKSINVYEKEISLNEISSGMYVMELVSENKKSIRKLIVN